MDKLLGARVGGRPFPWGWLFAALIVVAIVVLAIATRPLWSGLFGRDKVVAAETRVAGVQASGQAQAAGAAVAAAGQAAERIRIIDHIHEVNSHDILAAPGASDRLDPGLVDTARRGLCLYGAYRDDPGCAGLRGDDPAEPASAGQGISPPQP